MSILDPSNTFSSLSESTGLDTRLRKAVSRLGHVRPTLVQSKCLPLAISSGRDLLVRAKTGSGKTLAYCLPLLQKLLQRPLKTKGVGAIVLVPTRELCSQVYQTLKSLTYYCDDVISIAVLSAGHARNDKGKEELLRQEAMLRDRPSAIVATPGGLLRQIRNGTVTLDAVQTVVVDEADLVLSFGYSDDVSEIVKSLPKTCQGYLMSATLSPELDALKSIVLHSPVVLRLEEDDPGSRTGKLKQFYVKLPRNDKRLLIYVFLKLGVLKGKGLFFVNSTDAGYRLKLFLEQFHIRSAVLNAELPWRSRMNIIEQFNVGSFDYLIATDASTDVGARGKENDSDEDDDEKANSKVETSFRRNDKEFGVSRGLDFRNVSFVVNADFPTTANAYAHRIGRTARGGAKGVALSLVEAESKEQQNVLLAVQSEQPTVSIEKASTDNLQALPADGHDVSKEQCQPLLLDFDLQEIEGFRYRVEDVGRAVTKLAVKDARASELKAEILNSERLQSHLEENPADLQLLQHDRLATVASRVQDHLKHVPKYLLPRGMQVVNLNRRRKKRKRNQQGVGNHTFKNDPLQSYDSEVALDDIADDDEDPLAEYVKDDSVDDEKRPTKKHKIETKSKIYTSTVDGTGKSTAGRNQWKEKHRKGKFSGKKKRSERGRRKPLGL